MSVRRRTENSAKTGIPTVRLQLAKFATTTFPLAAVPCRSLTVVQTRRQILGRVDLSTVSAPAILLTTVATRKMVLPSGNFPPVMTLKKRYWPTGTRMPRPARPRPCPIVVGRYKSIPAALDRPSDFPGSGMVTFAQDTFLRIVALWKIT